MLTAMRRHTYAGACHCQNISVRLESDKVPSELPLRTDTCSFCSKHHAIYTSDPEGEAHLAARDADLVERYRFGTRTADFLVCKSCGVFIAAYMSEPPLAVINVNALDARAEFLKNEVLVTNLDAETVEQRLTRRRARWTKVASFVFSRATNSP
jgi:hypothetical protein